jgi:oligoribonuclease (3'-5' exoribonuclease)
MSAEEKEAEALRLLSEVARERHAGECVLVRVEMRGEGNARLELIDFLTRCSASSTALPCGSSVVCG